MEDAFSFTVNERDSITQARCGCITTPHGPIVTPAFVPVGTQGSVKSLDPIDLIDLDVHLYFVNTYHMVLRPGIKIIEKFGGIHRFMHWDRPVITDSGGFQIFSLGSKRFGSFHGDDSGEPLLLSMDNSGVRFRSHWDGTEYEFTPERSMEYQWIIGSDIHIAFDDCAPYPISFEKAARSLERTHMWATKSLSHHQTCWDKAKGAGKPYQALYGSIQGSVYEQLRKKSASFITGLPFDGFALGGVSVGESKEEMKRVLDWVIPLLPDSKPRHLLGVGEIDDVFELISHGIDTFDCVGPTRLARMGIAYVYPWNTSRYENDMGSRWKIDITKSVYYDDEGPLDSHCSCLTCQRFSRAYLAHLFRNRELLVYRLLTIHNIAFMNSLVMSIRKSIASSSFLELKNTWLYNEYHEGGHSMSMDFRHHEKKKVSKAKLEKRAQKEMNSSSWQLPQVEIIKKGKKENA